MYVFFLSISVIDIYGYFKVEYGTPMFSMLSYKYQISMTPAFNDRTSQFIRGQRTKSAFVPAPVYRNEFYKIYSSCLRSAEGPIGVCMTFVFSRRFSLQSDHKWQ